MLKHLILATFLTCGAAAAYAQTPPQPSEPASRPATEVPKASEAPKTTEAPKATGAPTSTEAPKTRAAQPAPRPTNEAAAPADRRPATEPAAPVERTVSTGDFNTSGQMAGSALIGSRVRNDAKDTVGKIDDVYVDNDGSIKTIVIAVGGFLGVGAKDVGLKWSDVKFGRDGDSLVVTTNLSKDELKAMPDYKAERRKPAPPVAPASSPASPSPRPGG